MGLVVVSGRSRRVVKVYHDGPDCCGHARIAERTRPVTREQVRLRGLQPCRMQQKRGDLNRSS